MRALAETDGGGRPMQFADLDTIRKLLTSTETWAVVGCSPDPRRDSHRIGRLLQQQASR